HPAEGSPPEPLPGAGRLEPPARRGLRAPGHRPGTGGVAGGPAARGGGRTGGKGPARLRRARGASPFGPRCLAVRRFPAGGGPAPLRHGARDPAARAGTARLRFRGPAPGRTAVPLPRAELARHPLRGGARTLGPVAPRAPAPWQRARRSGPGRVRVGNGRDARGPCRRPPETRTAGCPRRLEGHPEPVTEPVGAAMAAPTMAEWPLISRTSPFVSCGRWRATTSAAGSMRTRPTTRRTF